MFHQEIIDGHMNVIITIQGVMISENVNGI